MALNREVESIQHDSSHDIQFGDFSWNSPMGKEKRRLEIGNDSESSSPKRMAIDQLTIAEDNDSPVVIHIGNEDTVVMTADSDGTLHESTAVEYLNNDGAVKNIFDGPTMRSLETNETLDTEQREIDTIGGFPSYRLKRHSPFLNEILELCMGLNIDTNAVCSQVPVNVQEAAIFAVDFQCVRHHDVVARDRGCFGRQSSPTRHVAVKFWPDGTIEDIKTIKIVGADGLESGYEFYKIRRHYTWHKFIAGLSRIITRLEYKNELFRYGVVQFKVAEEDKSFASNFKPNSTGKEQVQRGTSSTERTRPSIQSPQEASTSDRSFQSIHVSSVRGTFTGARPSCLPKSSPPAPRSQVEMSSCKNEIFNILQNADKPRVKLSKVPDFSKLLSLLKCDEFLCDVSFCSIRSASDQILNPRTFAMGKLQRNWLKSFCTGNNTKSLVSISTIYKLGNHYLTALTCRLPIFVLRDDPAQHPVVLLALMTSLTNEVQDYEYLASNLHRQGIKGMVYGTDGDPALDAALERTFPIQYLPQHTSNPSIHLCCFDKVKDTVSRKLEDLHVKNDHSKKILRQIFGSESAENSGNDAALVDQPSEAKFRELLSVITQTWPPVFRDWMTKNKENSDRPLSETLKKCMLRSVRSAAGLGDPPSRYNNRASSACIDEALEELEQEPKDPVDLVKVHEILKARAVDSQITEFVKAMYNMGEVRLAKDYQHLKVSLLNVDN